MNATAEPSAASGIELLGPKAWGLIYLSVLWFGSWISRRIVASCTSSQRNRLRDSYEDELRHGGQLTNRLLLPRVGAR